MKILQRYITSHLLWMTALSLTVLVLLFDFFTLIDQLQEIRGNYGVFQVMLYILLTTPKLIYELLPISAVIGSMAALGILARNSELAVIYTSGISKPALALMLGKSGLVLMLFIFFIGEFVTPVSERIAQYSRSMAMMDQIAMKTRYGFWARDGDSYINIRKILPGDRAEEIFIYEFDNNHKLLRSTFAKSAYYEGGYWLLSDIRRSTFENDKVTVQTTETASWGSLLKPEMVNYVAINPQYLTLWGLVSYIGFLKQNAQNAYVFEQAFWMKLTTPITVLAMVLLAIPLVHSNARFTAVGQRVFVGAFIGIIFHISDQTVGQLGLVFNIHPAVSVTTPTLFLLAVIFYLLRR